MARYSFLIVAALLTSSSSLLAASISGTVTAAENGLTLSGIVVAAYSPDGTLQAIATSDSFGRYTLTVPAGQTRVLAYDLAGTYATNYYLSAASFETSTTFDLTQSQSVSGVNISMVRGGRITGKVVADGSGMALPEMTVAAYTPSGIRRERVQSDQTGNFSLLLPPGDYILAAWDEQFVYLTEFYSNVAKASLATIVRVAAGTTLSGHDFSLAPGATVSGSVRDQATGNALIGITVSAYSSAGELLVRTVSDSSGLFDMAVPPGKVRFVAHDDAALYAGSFYNDAESFSVAAEFLLSSGQFLSGIDFRVQKAGRVTGRVTDAATGAGLQGITVIVYNLSGTARQIVTSDATGAFTAVVPPGYYKTGAFDGAEVYAYQFWANSTTFARSDTLLVSAEQESSVSFSLHRGARVSGSTTDRDLDTPLSGIVVAAMDTTGAVIASVVSDGSGTYTLFLPPGSYKLAASDPAGHYEVSYEGSASSFETAASRNLTAGQVVTGVAFELPRKAVPSQVRRRPVTRHG